MSKQQLQRRSRRTLLVRLCQVTCAASGICKLFAALTVIFSGISATALTTPPLPGVGAAGAGPAARRSKYDASFLFSEPRACLAAGTPFLNGRGVQSTNFSAEPGPGDIAGNGSATSSPSSWPIFLVVNPDPSVPCCGDGDAASVATCISIAKAAWLRKGDVGCDSLCGEASDFFTSMNAINVLQTVTMSFGAVATFMWMCGTLCYWSSSEKGSTREPNLATKCAFLIWLVCCVATITCQCVELGFVSNGNLLQAAGKIKAAACYNSEGAFGYNEITGNLRSTQILLWGEMVVSAMSLFIGIYSLTEVFGTKDAKVAPMLLETVTHHRVPPKPPNSIRVEFSAVESPHRKPQTSHWHPPHWPSGTRAAGTD